LAVLKVRLPTMNPGFPSGALALLRRMVLSGCIVIPSLVLCACGEEPRPRSFTEFMEDSIAREGVLARCDRDRQAAQADIECANARRAAVAIALEAERERLEVLERESERKLEQLRAQVADAERAAAASAAAAAEAEEEAYERLWREQTQVAADQETGADASSAAETSEWASPNESLSFSPLNRLEPETEGELAEATLGNGTAPAP
jgi:seryl-tRNA synthetase